MTDVAKLRIEVESNGVRISRERLVDLDRQGRRTERGIKTATGRMRHEFRALEQSAFGLKGALAGLAGIGGVGLAARSMYRLVEGEAALIKETQALARATNSTVNELQAFEYAADRVGVGSDKAGDIIKDLRDKIGDFATTGGGELAEPFKQLNLSIGEFVGLSPTEQLIKMGAAIEDLPNESQVFILESLADDASRLLPLLKDNAAGLRRFTQEANDLGVAMDRVDAQKLLEASAAMGRLRGQGQGLRRDLAVALTPAVIDLTDELDDLGQMMRSSDFQQGISLVGSGLSWVAGEAVRAVEDLSKFYEVMQRPWDEILKGFVTGDYSRPGATGSWQKGASGSWGESTLETIEVEEDPIINPYTPPKASSQLNPLTRDDGMAHTRDMIQQEADRLRELDNLRRTFASPDELAVMDFEERAKAIDRYAITQAEKTALMSQNWQKLTDDINDQAVEINTFADRAAENIQDQLGTTLSQTLRGDFEGIGESWKNMVMDMAAQAQAAQLNKALFGGDFGKTGDIGGLLGMGIGAIGGMFGGPGAASVSTSFADAGIGSMTAGGGGSMFGGFFAEGGDPPVGKWSIVGEQGPELIGPRTPTTVIPNHAITQGGSNSGPVPVEFHLHNEGGQVEKKSVRAERQLDGRLVIRAMVKSAMNDMTRTGEMDAVLSPLGVRRQGQI